MEAVRVLHVVGKMHRGGIETFLMNVYRRINRDKIQFDFLCFTKEEGYYDKEIYELGGRIFYAIPRRENIKKNKQDIYNILIEHPEIEVLQLHMSSCSYITPLFIAKKAGVKARIAHSHNTQCAGIFRNLTHVFNKQRLLFCATDFFACSNAAGEWMFPSKSWRNGKVINNGIESSLYSFDPNKRIQMKKMLGIENAFVIGYVGRFTEQKNMLFTCEIFKALCSRYDDINLLLVGDGSLHEEMDEFFKKAKLMDRVIYTGVVENVQDYFQAIDIFILPSLFEGLGIVAIEAQASGLKTLLSDKVPVEAFVTNLAYALPIDKGTKPWVNMIEKLRNKKSDRENTRQQIIKAGYDISESAKVLEDYYISCGEN